MPSRFGAPAALLLLLALATAACAPGRGGPPQALETPFEPVTLAELRANPQKHAGRKVTFAATIVRVEETSSGIWLHLKKGEDAVVLYSPISFGGTLRESLGKDEMEFQVQVGEKKLTPLGTTALEVFPYQISQTRYFDQPVPIGPPK